MVGVHDSELRYKGIHVIKDELFSSLRKCRFCQFVKGVPSFMTAMIQISITKTTIGILICL